MPKAKIKFLHKPNCTTCRKAKAFLEKKKVELEVRDLGKDRLSIAELDQLIGSRDHR
jgi:arsenate reductase-like glutaredoxin family protein